VSPVSPFLQPAQVPLNGGFLLKGITSPVPLNVVLCKLDASHSRHLLQVINKDVKQDRFQDSLLWRQSTSPQLNNQVSSQCAFENSTQREGGTKVSFTQRSFFHFQMRNYTHPIASCNSQIALA